MAFIGLCCGLLCLAVLGVGASHFAIDVPRFVPRQEHYRNDPIPTNNHRPIGSVGAVEDLGPVNRAALNEPKQGIIDRIRARRAAACLPCQPQSYSYSYSYTRTVPSVSYTYRTITPSTYIVPAPVVTYPIVSPPIYVEPAQVVTPAPTKPMMPSALQEPVHPTPIPSSNCPGGTCPKPSSSDPFFSSAEVKTGGFRCAHCQRETVGENWATDWSSENPVTFMCRHCWSRTNANQKLAAYKSWSTQQIASNGRSALLHPGN